MELVYKRKHLSARSFDRIRKVARTIADLEGSEVIDNVHIGEAIKLRNDVEFNQSEFVNLKLNEYNGDDNNVD